MLLLKTK